MNGYIRPKLYQLFTIVVSMLCLDGCSAPIITYDLPESHAARACARDAMQVRDECLGDSSDAFERCKKTYEFEKYVEKECRRNWGDMVGLFVCKETDTSLKHCLKQKEKTDVYCSARYDQKFIQCGGTIEGK